MDGLDNATHRLLHAQADIAYHLYCFGDHLAEREKYTHHAGLDAARHYLMIKHGWTPATVRSMSHDDLEFALVEEMTGWIVPKARQP